MSSQNSDLSNKIAQIMADPESMKQIQQLGSILGLTDNEQKQNNKQESKVTENNNEQSNNSFDISPDIMKTVMKIAPLLSSINKENKNTVLLNALRPFLSASRRKRLDESAKILSLLEILPLLKDSGLF